MKRIQRFQPSSAPYNSQHKLASHVNGPFWSTGSVLPHLGSVTLSWCHMEQMSAFPIQLCLNCRGPELINDGCFKPLDFGVVCCTSIDKCIHVHIEHAQNKTVWMLFYWVFVSFLYLEKSISSFNFFFFRVLSKFPVRVHHLFLSSLYGQLCYGAYRCLLKFLFFNPPQIIHILPLGHK